MFKIHRLDKHSSFARLQVDQYKQNIAELNAHNKFLENYLEKAPEVLKEQRQLVRADEALYY